MFMGESLLILKAISDTIPGWNDFVLIHIIMIAKVDNDTLSRRKGAFKSSKAVLVYRPEGRIPIKHIKQIFFPPNFRTMMITVLPAP